MTNRFTPPSPQRLSAVAIAAALTAFAGIAGAQTTSGYASSGGGNTLYSGSGNCVRTQATPAGVCPPMRSTSTTAAAAPARAGEPMQLAQAGTPAAAGATAASGASTTAGGPQATPGYVRSSDGRVVLSGSGQCVRAGSWTAANAAEPCERVARAELAPPPVVAAAPAPTPAPAPEPKVEAPPAPAPIAVAPAVVEPPRPVIQKLTLSTDVLFDFGKAELKDSGKQRLDQMLSEIKDADVDEIIAVGHADRIASEDFNQKLSEARAEAVKNYLQQEKGARAQRVTAEGKGESQPVTGEDCKKLGAERAANKKLVACLQPDRRVEIEVLGSRTVAGGAPAAGTGSSAPAGSGTTR